MYLFFIYIPKSYGMNPIDNKRDISKKSRKNEIFKYSTGYLFFKIGDKILSSFFLLFEWFLYLMMWVNLNSQDNDYSFIIIDTNKINQKILYSTGYYWGQNWGKNASLSFDGIFIMKVISGLKSTKPPR